MSVFYYLLIIFIVACIIAIWYMNTYNNYQSFIIRMNESENFIDTTLRKRFDLLNKSINIIKANKKTKEPILDTIVKLKSKKLNNFDLDRQLYEAINEFNNYKESMPELHSNETFLKIELGLFESESEIVAARKYYNDIVTDYNKLTKTFPSNIVAKICGYKSKTYYDGKDLEKEKEEVKI